MLLACIHPDSGCGGSWFNKVLQMSLSSSWGILRPPPVRWAIESLQCTFKCPASQQKLISATTVVYYSAHDHTRELDSRLTAKLRAFPCGSTRSVWYNVCITADAIPIHLSISRSILSSQDPKILQLLRLGQQLTQSKQSNSFFLSQRIMAPEFKTTPTHIEGDECVLWPSAWKTRWRKGFLLPYSDIIQHLW